MNIEEVSIIVEAPDAAGKSTIIKHLQEKLNNIIYHHFEFPFGKTNEERYGFQFGQFDLMFKMIEKAQKKTRFIFDRAHIGEYIYGVKYRNKFPEYLPILEAAYSKLPIIILRVYCDPDVILERFKQRPNEKPPTKKEIITLQEEFRIYCDRSPFRTISIDTTDLKLSEDISTAVDIIINTIKEI